MSGKNGMVHYGLEVKREAVRLVEEEHLSYAVQAVYKASHKVYGYRRITIYLQDKQGLRINHKAVLRLMRKLGIRSVARQPNPYRKMKELEIYHQYANVLERDFLAKAPNQKWCTDIT